MEQFVNGLTKTRQSIEIEWDKEVSKVGTSKSKFDKGMFYGEDYSYYCLNALKYTYEQALEELCKGDFLFIVKSFVRHRVGISDKEPTSSWFCGDMENGYHSVPVWMLTDDSEYYAPDGWEEK